MNELIELLGARVWVLTPPAIVLAALTLSCACGLERVPLAEAGVPDDRGMDAFSVALRPCETRLSEIGRAQIRGVVGGRHLAARFSFAIFAGLATRLESLDDSGRTRIVLWANFEEGTGSIWLPREAVATAQRSTEDLMEVLWGIRLSAADLARVLVCPSAGGGSWEGALRLSDGWQRMFAKGPDAQYDIYTQPRPHRLAHVTILRRDAHGSGWRGDFIDHGGEIWQGARLRSIDLAGQTGTAFDVEIHSEATEANPASLDLAALSPSIPASTRQIDLAELRRLLHSP